MSQSKRKENLAVFMGSGVSSFENPEYPIWNGVTQRLKNELPDCKSDDALDVAQEYLDKYGKEKLKNTVSTFFPDSSPKQNFYNELLYKNAFENEEVFDNINYLKIIQENFENAVFDEKTEFHINVLMAFYLLGSTQVKDYLKTVLLDYLDRFPSVPVPNIFREMLCLKQIKIYKNWYTLKLIEIGLRLPEQEFIKCLEGWLNSILTEQGTSSQYRLIINEIFVLNNRYPQFTNSVELCKRICE